MSPAFTVEQPDGTLMLCSITSSAMQVVWRCTTGALACRALTLQSELRGKNQRRKELESTINRLREVCSLKPRARKLREQLAHLQCKAKKLWADIVNGFTEFKILLRTIRQQALAN